LPYEFNSFFIGGRWVAPTTSARIRVNNASTAEYLGSVPEGIESDMDKAVTAARDAFDDPAGWSTWPPERRAAALESFAEEVEKRSEEIALRVSLQNGMPISTARSLEAEYPSKVLRYYADVIRQSRFEESDDHMFGGMTTVVREPLGVVCAIAPWNFPQTLAVFKYAPALAAGCTVVLKPSPETVLDSIVLAEAAEASDLPPGVFNIVPGGAVTGAYLVAHPDVDKVAFTGSTGAGRAIAETCGRLLRPVTLELGGKSAAIILDDAELDLAEIGERLYAATLLNSGQACFLGTRILAPASRFREVTDTFAELMASLKVGSAIEEGTKIGPMATERHRDRVEGYISNGISEGARLITGGGRPSGVGDGWFVEPTLFADVDQNSTIAQEEIFGPVLSVISYRDDDEAVAIANNSKYGLGGSVWTGDPERGQRIARRIQTGTVGINRYRTDIKAPFGGIKDSGLGRELGPGALSNFQTTKSIFS
jgi:aldehyde dehydrogenase (NAD+)